MWVRRWAAFVIVAIVLLAPRGHLKDTFGYFKFWILLVCPPITVLNSRSAILEKARNVHSSPQRPHCHCFYGGKLKDKKHTFGILSLAFTNSVTGQHSFTPVDSASLHVLRCFWGVGCLPCCWGTSTILGLLNHVCDKSPHVINSY